jgi:hypothetical protein
MSGAEATARAFVVRARASLAFQATAVFGVLTALLFWRYAASFTTTVPDAGDSLLIIWIMEWVERALTHAPSELFDAPMFHPFRDTLAYSDPLLPQALMALPLRLVGAGPVAAYNFVFLGSIVLAGVLTTMLFHELTQDRAAALAGAVVATFPAARLAHLAHLQLQVTVFWPVALLLIHRLAAMPRGRHVIALALALAAAPLASLYYGVFMALLLPPFALALWIGSSRSPRSLLALAGAAALAGSMLWPFARVYTRALGFLGQSRNVITWPELSHYFGTTWFADVSRWLPSRWVVEGDTPQWVGGGGALLLPVAAVAIGAETIRRRRRTAPADRALPAWAATSLPYVLMGCLAIFISLPPELSWFGHRIAHNPFSRMATLPGVRQLRDMQRTIFPVAIAGGALLAVLIGELRRRRPRLAAGLMAAAVVSTIVPAFSTVLPAHRPPPLEQLEPVYQWLAQQPEPMVIYEVPEAPFGEPMDFLWAAVHHKKRLVHGFSGYLPATDVTLRGETLGAYRPDFWRTLGMLGATHLVVHQERLSELPGGAATSLRIDMVAAAWRVATFRDADVYRVPPVSTGVQRPEHATPLSPMFTSGGQRSDPVRPCFEIRPNGPPLVAYVPDAAKISGVRFVAGTSFGDMEDVVQIERSEDLGAWRPAAHEPLMSTSLASYVQKPTATLWTRALVPPEEGSFMRMTSRGPASYFLCDLSFEASAGQVIEPLAPGFLRVTFNVAPALAPLALDGNPATRWDSGQSQNGSEWLEVDLGAPREIVAAVLELGHAPRDYGRELALDCAETPEVVVSGATIDGQNLLFERPHAAQVLPLSPPRRCRRLRIRQTGRSSENHWSVSELGVYVRPEGLRR